MDNLSIIWLVFIQTGLENEQTLRLPVKNIPLLYQSFFGGSALVLSYNSAWQDSNLSSVPK